MDQNFSFLNIHAPTKNIDGNLKEGFFEGIGTALNVILKIDVVIIIRTANAKILGGKYADKYQEDIANKMNQMTKGLDLLYCLQKQL